MNIHLPPEHPSKEEQATERQQAARRSTWMSIWVNLCLTIAQVLTGVIAHSQGLIADGIHSLSDLIADFVVLFANHHSKKEADEDHHYGHYRYETAASLFLGALLLLVAVGMEYAAINKLQHQDALPMVSITALWVAGGALLAKELLFRYMLSIANRVKSTLLVTNAWHARSDAASSLVVMLGITGSLMGYPLLDPIAALVVGLVIAKMGWSFAWNALHDLMDRSADAAETEQIYQTILSVVGVAGAHELRTRKMGDMLLVDVHIEVDGRKTVKEGHDIALVARNLVLSRHRVLNMMTHVDPV